MSDERIDVVLREENPEPDRWIWQRLWQWLKRNFPLVTRSGAAFASAKVEQEQAKARLIQARADVESAKAAAIRAKTMLRLSGLESDNARVKSEISRLSAREAEELTEELRTHLAQVTSRAAALGIHIEFEETTSTPKLISGPIDETPDP